MRHCLILVGVGFLLAFIGDAPESEGATRTPAGGLSRLAAESSDLSTEQITGDAIRFGFERNIGQADSRVAALLRCRNYTAYLLGTEVGIVGASAGSQRDVFRLRFAGASAVEGKPGRVLPAKSNYLIGADRKRWIRDVPHHEAYEFPGVYPGIGTIYREERRSLRLDLHVAARTDPSLVVLEVSSGEVLVCDEAGGLTLAGRQGRLTLSAPIAYQHGQGGREPVACRWELRGTSRVGFRVEGHDPARPLTIDPTFTYATYLGGSADETWNNGLAVDASGDVYVAGTTISTDFPTTAGAYKSSKPGGTSKDLFVAKLASGGTSLRHATYIGGQKDDEIHDMCLDSSGNVYLAGFTLSNDYPSTSGAYRSTMTFSSESFLTKLNSTGTALVYSTFLGPDRCKAVGVDSSGYAYPVLDPSYKITVLKLKTDGSGVLYSTSIDASPSGVTTPNSIHVDSLGNVHVAGSTDSSTFPSTTGAYQTSVKGGTDAFALRLDTSGSVAFATLLGGSKKDYGMGVGIDLGGRVYVAGYTNSTDFPTTSGAFQSENQSSGQTGFVTRLAADGSKLSYSTYLGGSTDSYCYGLATHFSGAAYVVGWTACDDFPVKDAHQGTRSGGLDAFVVKLDHTGDVAYSTYLGGTGPDHGLCVKLQPDGSAAVHGKNVSSDFPTTSGVVQPNHGGVTDSWVAVFSDNLPTSVDPLQFSTTSLPDGGLRLNYSHTLESSGGLAPFTWAIVSGSLPAGLTLSSEGAMSGTPTADGTASFTIALNDRTGARATRDLTLKVWDVPLIVADLPDWTVTLPYDQDLTVVGGIGALQWAIDSGSLPTGTILSGGRLSGTLTESGSFAFTLRVTDTLDSTSTKAFQVEVNPYPTISTDSLPDWTVTRVYDEKVEGSGGTEPRTWSLVSGTLPVDGPIGPLTGVLAGLARDVGLFQFEVRLQDAVGATVLRSYAVRVNPWPEITTDSLPMAGVGRPYAAHLERSGGTEPLEWLSLPGSLPSGVKLDQKTGVLSANSVAAAFKFQCDLKDASGATAQRAVSVSVAPRMSLSAKKNREELLILPGTAGPRFRFLELLAGSELTLKLKLIGEGDLHAEVRLLDPQEAPLLLAPYLKTKKKSLRCKAIPILKTGRYFLRIDVTTGFGGAVVRLDVEAEAPKTITGMGTITSGEPIEVVIPVLAGSKISATVKAAKKSLASPGVASLTDAKGTNALYSAKVKEKSNKVTVKVKVPMAGGNATATLIGREGTSGAIIWKFKVSRPTLYDLDLPSLPSGW
jgi:Putative Ig domain/Beta-propeller repeat